MKFVKNSLKNKVVKAVNITYSDLNINNAEFNSLINNLSDNNTFNIEQISIIYAKQFKYFSDKVYLPYLVITATFEILITITILLIIHYRYFRKH